MAASRSRSTPARRQRGERRRREILEAALRVIGRDGVAGLTHRAVADEAGVSLAATTYYFASKADLLREASELEIEGTDAAVAERAAHRPAPSPPTSERLAAEIAGLLAATDPARRLAHYELGLEAGRRTDLRGLTFAWAERDVARLLRALVGPRRASPSRG